MEISAPGTPVISLARAAGLVRSMRELETEHVAPKGERPLEVRDRDAGVIGGE